MRRLARWSARHPLLVALFWLLAIGGAQASSTAVGEDFRNSFSLPGTDSQEAVDLLEERFPERSGDADTIVISTDGRPVTDSAVQRPVQEMLDDVAAVDSVTAVANPYSPTGASQVSADGTVAYAAIRYDSAGIEVPRSDLEAVVSLVEDAGGEGLDVNIGGQGVASLSHPEVGAGELLGVAVAALVLLLAFRAPVAMVLPIVSAAAALGVSTGVIRLASNVTTVSDVAPTLGVLLGLGVGIDYALFIVNRHRGNLRSGMPVRESIVAALTTSGRAVVFAGTVVVLALLGMFVTGIEFLYGLAIGAAVAVVFTVLASITLLPAMLAAAGTRVLGRRHRTALAAGAYVSDHSAGAFRRWAGLVQRRPALLVVLALGALVVVATPATDLRLGTADQGNDPVGTTTREAYDTLAEGFGPGVNGPLVLAADLSADSGAADADAAGADAAGADAAGADVLRPLVERLSSEPGVASVAGPLPNGDGTAAVIQVVPTTGPQHEATSELIERVRTEIVPDVEAASGVEIHVGGPTATFDDFAEEI
ncbi:MAG: MMPL family transporter, partial [bacterium]